MGVCGWGGPRRERGQPALGVQPPKSLQRSICRPMFLDTALLCCWPSRAPSGYGSRGIQYLASAGGRCCSSTLSIRSRPASANLSLAVHIPRRCPSRRRQKAGVCESWRRLWCQVGGSGCCSRVGPPVRGLPRGGRQGRCSGQLVDCSPRPDRSTSRGILGERPRADESARPASQRLRGLLESQPPARPVRRHTPGQGLEGTDPTVPYHGGGTLELIGSEDAAAFPRWLFRLNYQQ